MDATRATFPLRIPKQPGGEPPPTCGADYAGQLRTFVGIPGYADGIYACVPGAVTWEPIASVEAIQDAIGSILVDSASIDFTYTDATPAITAAAIFGTTATTVAAGNHTHSLTPTLTARTGSVSITAGASDTVTVTCNAGEVATGGGCMVATSGLVIITESRPSPSSGAGPTGWKGAAQNNAGAARTLDCSVVCLKSPIP